MVMRSKGRVLNLFVSPVLLGLASFFGLLLVAFTVYINYSYLDLLNQYGSLKDSYSKLNKEAKYLAYQNSVTKLKKEADPENMSASLPAQMIPAAVEPPVSSIVTIGEQTENNNPAPPIVEDAPVNPPVAAGSAPLSASVVQEQNNDPLDGWAAAHLPELAPDSLSVERFSLNGAGFRFILAHENDDGSLAQGRILVVFAVKKGEDSRLSSYPELDLEKPDFNSGPSYSIKSNKTFSGRIKLDNGAQITSAMVLAFSRNGQLVMKQKFDLADNG